MNSLDRILRDCGFNQSDAARIMGEFLTGIANVGEAKGAPSNQTVGAFLTEKQAGEVLRKALDDRIAALPESDRAKIDLEILKQKFGY
jgi:hypothetical protein